MKKSKVICLSSLAVFSLVSCGAANSFTHPQSSDIRNYKADLNHDGKIERFENPKKAGEWIEEDNLTWAEAYDTLIGESKDTELLNLFADKMGIAKNEPERTNLARYEIMHEAEELTMNTGAMIPLYNYQDPYLLKPNISDIYSSGIAGKFFDQLTKDGKNNQDFKFSIGTKANSFDPAINDDASTANVITNCFAGLCKWEKGKEIPEYPRTYDTHIAINYDILTSDGFVKETDKTTGKAKYTFKLKPNLTFINNAGETHPLTVDNFIWSWNRAASPYTGTWIAMFENIEGYDKWVSDCEKLIEQGKKADFSKGMTGIKKESADSFSVQLINDCAYFKDLLAFPAYMPLDIQVVKDNDTWWLDPKTFSTNGRFRITELKNFEAGGIKMERWDDYPCTVPTKAKSMYLSFLDSDSAMWDKYKNGSLDMIDSIATSLIEKIKRERPDEWKVAPQVGVYYFLHNVNDNTFDIKANQSETDRENLRKAFNLLINRYDYTQTIVRSGCTDANGFVSTGIIEQCIPGKKVAGTPGVGEPNAGLWCKRYTKGTTTEVDPPWDETTIKNTELATADWHTRNKNMYDYLDSAGSYKNHWLDKREKGGFYDTVSDSTMTQEQVMRNNIAKAIELAKSAGVNYSGDIETGKFTNFPTVSVTTNTGTGHEALCERMQASLDLFGIKLRIETQEWNAFQTTKKRGAFCIARNGWIADYSDPLTYLSIMASDNPNNDTQLGKTGFHKSR